MKYLLPPFVLSVFTFGFTQTTQSNSIVLLEKQKRKLMLSLRYVKTLMIYKDTSVLSRIKNNR